MDDCVFGRVADGPSSTLQIKNRASTVVTRCIFAFFTAAVLRKTAKNAIEREPWLAKALVGFEAHGNGVLTAVFRSVVDEEEGELRWGTQDARLVRRSLYRLEDTFLWPLDDVAIALETKARLGGYMSRDAIDFSTFSKLK